MLYQQQFDAIVRCPISGNIMVDPIVTPQGKTYDRASLIKHLQDDKNSSTAPHGEQIDLETINTSLKLNHRVKKLVKDFHEIRMPAEDDYHRLVESYEAGIAHEKQIIAVLDNFFIKVAGCPITGRLMQDPVITPDGQCYEREALEHYLEQNNNQTPEKVEIPANPSSQRELIVSNKMLQREVKNFLEEMPIRTNQNAMLGHYLKFFNKIAWNKITFEVLQDPAILTADPDRHNQVSGGITGIGTWSEQSEQEAAENYDPVDGSHLPFVASRKHQLFAYKTLQDALINLKAELNHAGISEASLVIGDDNELESNWESLISVTSYMPYEYQAQKPGELIKQKKKPFVKLFPLQTLLIRVSDKLYIIGDDLRDELVHRPSNAHRRFSVFAPIMPNMASLLSVASYYVSMLILGLTSLCDCLLRIINPQKFDEDLSPNRARWTAAKQAGCIIAGFALIPLVVYGLPLVSMSSALFSIVYPLLIGFLAGGTGFYAQLSDKYIRQPALYAEWLEQGEALGNPIANNERAHQDTHRTRAATAETQATTTPYLLWRNTQAQQTESAVLLNHEQQGSTVREGVSAPLLGTKP